MSDQLLHLFSSNIRPLYEQDILDLLAAPKQTYHQFRYDERYINPSALAQWEDLVGTSVLVHFSLQQRARYHDAVFIPVRKGEVVEARKFGRVHVLTFSLGNYVALREPRIEGHRTMYGEQVREYTEYLRKQGIPTPYDYSAGLGEDVAKEASSPLDTTAAEPVLFQRTVEFLAQTQSFQKSSFLRFAYLRRAATDDAQRELIEPIKDRFILRAGETYELAVAHTQARDVTTPTRFDIGTESAVLRLLGKSSFEIASPYDVISIVFQALAPSVLEARETVLHIDPDPNASGPHLRIRLRVQPALDKALVGAVGTAVGAVLVSLPTLAATVDGWKITSAALGAATLALAAAAGFRRA